MSNDKVPAEIGNESLTIRNTGIDILKDLPQIELFAESIANSETFSKAFQTKDEDGSIVVNKSDIIAAVVLGSEMGISPMASVMLGKRLNQNAYFSVQKGKSMGIDPVTAIDNIYQITTKRGTISYTGIHIVTGALNVVGVQYSILEDAVPVYKYINAKTKNIVSSGRVLNDNNTLKDDFVLLEDIVTTDDIEKVKTSGQVVLTRQQIDTRTTIRFVRNDDKVTNDITIKYTLQQAIDAGLYMGYHSKLVDKNSKRIYVDGKSNWNNHPETLLRNKVLMIGARIIASDLLGGMYSTDELVEIVKDNEIVDITNEQND